MESIGVDGSEAVVCLLVVVGLNGFKTGLTVVGLSLSFGGHMRYALIPVKSNLNISSTCFL